VYEDKDVIDYVLNHLEVVFKTITVYHGDTNSHLDMDITFIGDKADLSMKGYVDQKYKYIFDLRNLSSISQLFVQLVLFININKTN
jgi:hypothetical protein